MDTEASEMLESRTRLVRHELRPRLLTVTHVETVAPRYVRVTFTGDDLDSFTTLDAQDHMRLALPLPGEETPTRPTWTARGPVWPEGQPKPIIRDYTPRRFDPTNLTLEIDFVIHGDGPASAWAERAMAGQQVGAVGPRGSHIVDDAFDCYLMLGDETMLPSIARRIEELPGGRRAIAIVEVESADAEQRIETAADVDIVWVHRGGVPAGTTRVLEDALRNLRFPDGDAFVWAGGEATTLKPIRRFLLRERDLPRASLSVSGHWKRDVADYDHHEPIDD